MSSYPAQIDNSDTLSVGADRIGSYTLETTLTAACTASDTTIAVADAIGPGFAAAAMHLRIGDEIVKYTGRTATTFTGLSRGLGSTAAAHAAGTPVRATFTWLQLLAMQQALIAIENVIGAAGAYNFAAVNHGHAAGDVTSGTMAVARLPVMGAASAGAGGSAGLAPASAAGDQAKFLRADATWQTVSAGSTTASVVSVSAAGTMPSGNVQERLQDLWTGKADQSTQVIAGAGASGGGALSGDVTINIDVRTVHGRTGNVVAAAGDYQAHQVDLQSSISGMSATTVQAALAELRTQIVAVANDLSANYYNKTAIDAGFETKSAFNAHSHNVTINADGGHDHGGAVAAQADHTHTGFTGTPI